MGVQIWIMRRINDKAVLNLSVDQESGRYMYAHWTDRRKEQAPQTLTIAFFLS